MKALLQAALRVFRPSATNAPAAKPKEIIKEVTITVEPHEAQVVPIEKKLPYTVWRTIPKYNKQKDVYEGYGGDGGIHDLNMKKERQIDEIPISYGVIKLSEHVSQQIVNQLRLGRVVRVYFGTKTLTSTTSVLDAFINGPGNGYEFNISMEKAIPQGANILHEDTLRFIRDQLNGPIKMTKISSLDRSKRHHCYLAMDTNWDFRN